MERGARARRGCKRSAPEGQLRSPHSPFFILMSSLSPLLPRSPHLLYSPVLPSLSPGIWPVPSGAECPSGFRGCLPDVSQLLRRAEEGGGGGGLCCALVPERAGSSTTDSASPGPDALAPRRPCFPTAWAPIPAAGCSRSPPPQFLPGGLPGSTSVPAPQPAPRGRAESPGPGLRVWRPW